MALLDQALADLRFDAAANAVYHFVWDQFCDWYIELIKGNFDAETKAVAGWVLDQILVMLHPFMPFVTEELWSALGDRAGYPLITAKWPEPGAEVDAAAKAEVEWLIALISSIRSARAEVGVPPSTKLSMRMRAATVHDANSEIVRRNRNVLERMARIAELDMVCFPGDVFNAPNAWTEQAKQVGEEIKKGSLFVSVAGFEAFLPLDGAIDIAAEKIRLSKALEASEKEAKSLNTRLGNPNFVEKAKPEAIEKARADYYFHTSEAERLAAALARLG